MASTNDRKKVYREDLAHRSEHPPLQDRKRREVVKKIALGTAALTGCSLLPERWTTPLAEFGALPAHATTSGLIEELARAIEQSEAEKDAAPAAAAAAEQENAPQPAESKAAQPAAEKEEGSEWTRVVWGGDPNDADHDRTWWTKVTDPTDKWWRKFPLPRWLDDKSYAVDFRFSSGRTFYVPNSQKMEMDPNGPKYRQETPGEPDSRKQHPKIAEEYGKNETWVEFKVR